MDQTATSTQQDQSDYELEDRILESLKARDGVATAGDVAADTGIAFAHVERSLRRMLSDYRSHLDVDDDGNLRYRFDPSFRPRGRSRARLWHGFKKAAWKVSTGLFKAWTVIMLIGYTAVFVLLLLALGIAGFALAAQSDDDGGAQIGLLPILLVGRFLEFMFWFSVFSPSPSRASFRSTRRARLRNRGLMSKLRARPRPDKPFYQKVFHYLFGPERPRDPLAAERAFARFVRQRSGRITAAEWASRTGQSLQDAENALTASIVRFNGDVDVSSDGTLIYRFDDLRLTADDSRASSSRLAPIWERRVEVAPLTGNPKSTNFWITLFNLFNLGMSSAVLLIFSPILTLPAVIGLGWVPFVFSLLFFVFPLLRRMAQIGRRRRAARENHRREALSIVFQSARDGEARPIPQDSIPSRLQDVFLRDFDGDISVTDTGLTTYRFDRLSTELRDGAAARDAARHQNIVFGHTIFSSDEDEKSLHDVELDDFDQRLARELGGDTVLDFDASDAFVPETTFEVSQARG